MQAGSIRHMPRTQHFVAFDTLDELEIKVLRGFVQSLMFSSAAGIGLRALSR